MNKHLGALIGLAFGAVGTASLAACPTAADLSTGIRFTVDDDGAEVFRTMTPDVIESMYSYGDGSQYRNLLGKGVYLLEWLDYVDGAPDLSSRMTYAFATGPKDLPEVVPGGVANLSVLVNMGGDLDQEMEMYSFGEVAEISFGDCSYDMIPIEITYAPDDGQGTSILHYLPALGFAYFAQQINPDGSVDTYEYKTIEVVE